MKKITLVVVVILGNLAQYNLWPYILHDFFYKMEGFQYLLLGICLLVKEKQTELQAFWFRYLVWIFIIFTLNDIIDVCFFNPRVFQYNEWAFVVVAALFTFYKLEKRWIITQKHKALLQK